MLGHWGPELELTYIEMKQRFRKIQAMSYKSGLPLPRHPFARVDHTTPLAIGKLAQKRPNHRINQPACGILRQKPAKATKRPSSSGSAGPTLVSGGQ